MSVNRIASTARRQIIVLQFPTPAPYIDVPGGLPWWVVTAAIAILLLWLIGVIRLIPEGETWRGSNINAPIALAICFAIVVAIIKVMGAVT